MSIGMMLSGGGGGGRGITKVADAAALAALTAIEGDFAVRLDTDDLYYYNGSAWNIYVQDTDHGSLMTVISDLALHLADTADAHDASAISFSPVSSIASTDVQSAIQEVADEADTGLSNH